MEIRLVRIGEILEKIEETQPNMRAKIVGLLGRLAPAAADLWISPLF